MARPPPVRMNVRGSETRRAYLRLLGLRQDDPRSVSAFPFGGVCTWIIAREEYPELAARGLKYPGERDMREPVLETPMHVGHLGNRAQPAAAAAS
jgi:hypothetical protein